MGEKEAEGQTFRRGAWGLSRGGPCDDSPRKAQRGGALAGELWEQNILKSVRLKRFKLRL